MDIEKMRLRKRELGLTYKDIANRSGIGISAVQKIFAGKVAAPRQKTLDAIDEVLWPEGISVALHTGRRKREVSIGNQSFETIISNDYFYIDKTFFIKEWWDSGDVVTLIDRPRRFGKTLNMSLLDYFFSNRHENSGVLFENLEIWKDQRYRDLQGTYPVIFFSFADVKGNTYETSRMQIIQEIVGLYRNISEIYHQPFMNDKDRSFFDSVDYGMSDAVAGASLKFLCEIMKRYYGKKVIVLLDEYDTPLQEAYVDGFWEQMTGFIRSLFNATFESNPFLERGLLTGITRVSKESIFSDLNNLKVITITSEQYEDAFGFTGQEVRAALHEYEMSEKYEDVVRWYDGFRIGDKRDIFNPWSITRYLDSGKLEDYWANTSANTLVEKLIRRGTPMVKEKMESLLKGESIETLIDDEIVYDRIDLNESGVFSLLVAAGYLKIVDVMETEGLRKKCRLSLTNLEVRHMFQDMVRLWFEDTSSRYNDFIKALLMNDLRYMNRFMNDVALSTFSSFDSGNRPSEDAEPERFYHGFVLGLVVDLSDRYRITSNRESGFGRYDVCMEPLNPHDPAYVLEFKVHDPENEESLQETVNQALKLIREKNYDAELLARKISKDDIHHYGFAFEGKKVLIGTDEKANPD